MSLTKTEIAKEITLTMLQNNLLILPDTTQFEKISEFNEMKAKEVSNFFNQVLAALKTE